LRPPVLCTSQGVRVYLRVGVPACASVVLSCTCVHLSVAFCRTTCNRACTALKQCCYKVPPALFQSVAVTGNTPALLQSSSVVQPPPASFQNGAVTQSLLHCFRAVLSHSPYCIASERCCHIALTASAAHLHALMCKASPK